MCGRKCLEMKEEEAREAKKKSERSEYYCTVLSPPKFSRSHLRLRREEHLLLYCISLSLEEGIYPSNSLVLYVVQQKRRDSFSFPFCQTCSIMASNPVSYPRKRFSSLFDCRRGRGRRKFHSFSLISRIDRGYLCAISNVAVSQKQEQVQSPSFIEEPFLSLVEEV